MAAKFKGRAKIIPMSLFKTTGDLERILTILTSRQTDMPANLEKRIVLAIIPVHNL